MAVETPRDLADHLQWAIRLELSTIPTYLYAMYAIEDAGSEPYRLIRSVAVEEMLHLVLVGNVLTAVGGRPRFYDRAVVPSYPAPLPQRQPELTLDLQRPTPEAIGRVFTTIERPRKVAGLPDDYAYQTTGQFYRAIEDAVERLGERYPLFETCQVDSQLADPGYYAPVEYDDEGSGGLHAVEDVDTACRAIDTVIHQGEGLRDEQYADLDRKELTHYYKFKQLAEGTVPLGETRAVPTNPKAADLPESLRPVSELFDACYCYALLLLEHVYSPVGDETKDRLVDELYALMTEALRPLGRFLTRQPVEGNGGEEPKRAGPTFEFYRFDPGVDPAGHLREIGEDVAEHHPELDGVCDALERVEGL